MILLIPTIFGLAPKFARELGFLILGMFLIDPNVRADLTPMKTLSLSAFTLLLSVIISPLPRGKAKRIFYITVLGILSGLLGIMIKPFPLIAISYLLAFPITLTSYAYAFVTIAVSLLLHEVGLYSFPSPGTPNSNVLPAIILPAILIGYSIYIERKNIMMKRQTIMLLIFALLLIPFLNLAKLEFVLLMSAVSIRLITSLPHPEETL
ncbi:hypothetical protein [Thermococcus chitonophagus]|nr:hypothetical protein [Thermococcus chitonophagus]